MLIHLDRRKQSGFTLIEVLLVLVIISIIIYGSINYMQNRAHSMRVDKATTTMQQILNAGLAYYVVNGKWPQTLSDLTSNNAYLPNMTLNNPWGNPYMLKPAAATSAPPGSLLPPPMLYVYTRIPSGSSRFSAATAAQIAGGLPLGYATANSSNPPTNITTCTVSGTCTAVGMVNIPGQNLNNASAVNFAGIYHHGACVPVPQCPVDNQNNPMKPAIMVMPVSVGGYNLGNAQAYPLTSFTAYALPKAPTNITPPPCSTTSTSSPACPAPVGGNPTAYWRVCMKITTQYGTVGVPPADNSVWGSNVQLVAITRCSISNEPSGSPTTIFGD